MLETLGLAGIHEVIWTLATSGSSAAWPARRACPRAGAGPVRGPAAQGPVGDRAVAGRACHAAGGGPAARRLGELERRPGAMASPLAQASARSGQRRPSRCKRALDELETLAQQVSQHIPEVAVALRSGGVARLPLPYRCGVRRLCARTGPGDGRGGRYDAVGEVFGRARPACGFSADLKNLLALRRRDAEGPAAAHPTPQPTPTRLAGDPRPACRQGVRWSRPARPGRRRQRDGLCRGIAPAQGQWCLAA
jgi:ATP phosphoribosyltransferase regulatory subunit HisZ